MERDDISEHLVHFIRGSSFQESFGTLQKILGEGRLIGGTGFIKGNYRCVCFSEAPVKHLGKALVEPNVQGIRYKPFGVLVSKKWLFEQGGRPVIYQRDEEFCDLPEALRWRHVRYEPDGDPPIDFSWEREWRIPTESLNINPDVAWLVLPAEHWLRELEADHERAMDYEVQMYEQILGQNARLLVTAYPWDAKILNFASQCLEN